MYIVFRSEISKLIAKVVRLVGLQTSQDGLLELEPEHRSFGDVWRNRRDVASYRIEDNPRYNNLLYTMLVLDSLQKR